LAISTARGSGCEVVIGLAHQVMLPLVAEPLAAEVPPPPAEPDELPEPVLGVLDELLHAPSVSAVATPSAVSRTNLDLPRLTGTAILMVPSLPFSTFHLKMISETVCLLGKVNTS
jgi:hypothetical protein